MTSPLRMDAVVHAVRRVPLVVWDVLLAVVLIVGSIVTVDGDADFTPMDAVGWGAIVLACGATVLRTYAPFAGFLVSVAGLMTSTIGGYQPPVTGVSMVVLAGTVIYAAPRAKATAAVLVPPVVLTVMHLSYGSPLEQLLIEQGLFLMFATLKPGACQDFCVRNSGFLVRSGR